MHFFSKPALSYGGAALLIRSLSSGPVRPPVTSSFKRFASTSSSQLSSKKGLWLTIALVGAGGGAYYAWTEGKRE